MKVKEQSEKLIIIDDCTCQELDNLDHLAYSRLSGDGALLIHTNDLEQVDSTQARKDLIAVLRTVGGAQIGFCGLPDAFVLLRR
jgi:hypothetical protein